MIYQLDRCKAIKLIQEVINSRNDDVLQEMYRNFQNSKLITQADILKLWHGFAKLDEQPIEVLEDLLKFCLTVNADYGEYQEYLIEINTAEIKMRYFASLENDKTRYMAKQLFEVFAEKIESLFKKDLCQLTEEEALSGLSNLPNASISSLRQALTIARNYCKWCQENGAFNGTAKNPFKCIKVDDIPLEPWLKKNVVKDAVDLVLRLKEIIGINHGYVAPVAAALFWMGFSIKDSIELKNKDVDVYNRKVYNVDIPEELISIFVQYSGFAFVDGKDICGADCPYLKRISAKLKGVPYKEIDIQNALKVTGGLSYKNIRTSRVLFDLHKKESLGEELTDQDFIIGFRLNPTGTAHPAYLKDKKRLYKCYKAIYWS